MRFDAEAFWYTRICGVFVVWGGICFLQQPFAFSLSFARCICLTLIYIHEMAKHHGCHVCRRSIAIIFALQRGLFSQKALAHPLSLIHSTPHTEDYIFLCPRSLHMFTLSYAFTYSHRPDSSWSAGYQRPFSLISLRHLVRSLLLSL